MEVDDTNRPKTILFDYFIFKPNYLHIKQLHNAQMDILKHPRIGHMNMVKNACFELPTLEEWTKTGTKKAKLTCGNVGTPPSPPGK